MTLDRKWSWKWIVRIHTSVYSTCRHRADVKVVALSYTYITEGLEKHNAAVCRAG